MIRIENFTYQITGPVAPGATVEVTNTDEVTHTVTADDEKSFDVTVQPGKTATFPAPSTPGTYAFLCSFHADMSGKLIVK